MTDVGAPVEVFQGLIFVFRKIEQRKNLTPLQLRSQDPAFANMLR